MKHAFAIASLAFFSFSTAAWAAGDAPQTLNAEAAMAAFTPYKSLLTLGCPGSQNATAGNIQGGDSPFGGSQTVTLTFDGGATVTILNSWGGIGAGNTRTENTIKISCSLTN